MLAFGGTTYANSSTPSTPSRNAAATLSSASEGDNFHVPAGATARGIELIYILIDTALGNPFVCKNHRL